MMKRLAVIALMAMLIIGTCAGASAAEAEDRALLVIFPQEQTRPAGWHVPAYYIGQVSPGAFTPMDSARIALNGRPLDDGLRGAWAESPETMELSTGLLVKGQPFQLSDAPGTARVQGFDYNYSSASGDDYLCATLALGQELREGSGLVFAVAGDALYAFYPPHGEMVVTDADSSDGGYVSYELDFDGDGVNETLFWDRRDAAALDEEGVMHPLILSRGEKVLQTLDFYYDYSYTSPLEPQFIDLDSDGVYELILAGTGHNTYVSVYRFDGEAFVETGARYYSGD